MKPCRACAAGRCEDCQRLGRGCDCCAWDETEDEE